MLKPGELTGVKLMILYVLKSQNRPIPLTALQDICTTDELVNHFDFFQAADDLREVGLLQKSEENEVLSITRAGEEVLACLKNDIPYVIREKLQRAAMVVLSELKNEKQAGCKLTETSDGEWRVTLSISDGRDVMLETTLLVANLAAAEAVKKSFYASPGAFYNGVIKLLSKDYYSD